jgi:hypothetical protein
VNRKLETRIRGADLYSGNDLNLDSSSLRSLQQAASASVPRTRAWPSRLKCLCDYAQNDRCNDPKSLTRASCCALRFAPRISEYSFDALIRKARPGDVILRGRGQSQNLGRTAPPLANGSFSPLVKRAAEVHWVGIGGLRRIGGSGRIARVEPL